MRPYKFYQTWIDLDHVLAITPSDTVCQVRFDMSFCNVPVYIDYWGEEHVPALLSEWQRPHDKRISDLESQRDDYRQLAADLINWHAVVAYSDFETHEAAHEKLVARYKELAK